MLILLCIVSRVSRHYSQVLLLEEGNMAYNDLVHRDGLDTAEDTNVFSFVNRGRQKKREMSFKEHSRDMGTPRLDGDIGR